MRYMRGKVFIDTNILIYLFSDTEPEKRGQVQDLLKTKPDNHTIVWSTQIVQEFYQVMTAKYKKDPQKVKSVINQFDQFELVVNNMETIQNAIDIQILNKFSFWDSLVLSAAIQSRCNVLLTEDLTHDQEVDGISIKNPFY